MDEEEKRIEMVAMHGEENVAEMIETSDS